jgi:hypothetical protein
VEREVRTMFSLDKARRLLLLLRWCSVEHVIGGRGYDIVGITELVVTQDASKDL